MNLRKANWWQFCVGRVNWALGNASGEFDDTGYRRAVQEKIWNEQPNLVRMIEVAKQYSKLPAAWWQVCKILEKEKDWKNLLEIGRMSFDRFPNRAFGYNFSIKAMRALGDGEEAYHLAVRAVLRFPRNEESCVLLAICMSDRNEIMQSIDRYRQNVILFPHSKWSWFGFVKQLWASGALREADVAFRKALLFFEADKDIIVLGAQISEEIGDFEFSSGLWGRLWNLILSIQRRMKLTYAL